MNMEIEIIEHQQGSPEWHAHRASHFNSSEAAAMLGLDPDMSRNELLRMKATGCDKEFSLWVQKNILDKGLEFEAKALPIAEKIVGEDLYPVVLAVKPGTFVLPLSASLDGLTVAHDKAWEHKRLNKELVASIEAQTVPDSKWPQLEQALMLSGADSILFMASDGDEATERHLWYVSVPERRARLIAAWRQFAIDLANYTHVESKPESVGRAPDQLPALRIEVTGMVTASNLAEFKDAALAVFRGINTNLQTDQDFADAEKAVKFCKDAEDRLDAGKAHALSQTASIDELFRTVDAIKEEARSVRLRLEKLLKAEKENRRTEIVRGAQDEYRAYVNSLNERIGGQWMPTELPPFAEAIKGLKSLDSMRDKIGTAMANAKIAANETADMIEVNKKAIDDWSLVPDFSATCRKGREDFAAMLAMRKAQREESEQKRLDAERERIRAEEQAKLEAEAAKRFDNTEIAVIEEAGSAAAKSESGAMVETGETMKLGEICNRLGFTVTADFLASIGFSPVGNERAAKLYLKSSFGAICSALVVHINKVGNA